MIRFVSRNQYIRIFLIYKDFGYYTQTFNGGAEWQNDANEQTGTQWPLWMDRRLNHDESCGRERPAGTTPAAHGQPGSPTEPPESSGSEKPKAGRRIWRFHTNREDVMAVLQAQLPELLEQIRAVNAIHVAAGFPGKRAFVSVTVEVMDESDPMAPVR